MSCNGRKLPDIYGYNVVKGRVQRILNRQGGMQISNNFQNACTCIYEQNGKKLYKSLKAISYSKVSYQLFKRILLSYEWEQVYILCI